MGKGAKAPDLSLPPTNPYNFFHSADRLMAHKKQKLMTEHDIYNNVRGRRKKNLKCHGAK